MELEAGDQSSLAERVSPPRGRCMSYLSSELHYTALCCCYQDSKAFAFTPWLPLKWKWQWPYLLYRWIIMLYFVGWLFSSFVSAAQTTNVQAKYLIYLTNWGFVCFNVYLFMAAVSVTVTLYHHLRVRPPTETLPPLSARGGTTCTLLNTVNGLHWATAIVGLEFPVAITVLFWSFFSNVDPNLTFSISSVHVHLLNGIIAFLDTWITGVPFRILHVVYVILFGCVYVVFSAVYYAAGGTDIRGHSYIYPVLDYGGNPGLAAGVAVGCGLVFTAILHLIFYAMYLTRYWLSTVVQSHCYRGRARLTGGCGEEQALTMQPERTVVEQ